MHYLSRRNYKGYLLESRLHFRIHATRLSLGQISGEDPVSDTFNNGGELSPTREVTPNTPVKAGASFDSSGDNLTSIDDGTMNSNGATGIS